MPVEDEEIIELSDNQDGADSDLGDYDRRTLLFPIITRVVDALGGREVGEYRLGDDALACLKDLKKLWRKDDDDDERTVARIFYETRVLPNDLIPILLLTAGSGLVEDKRAIACADLITAMTWPIDMAEELRELDDELDRGTDYTQLLRSHLEYKAALLAPGVIHALFGLVVPPLAKPPRERTQRDGQVVHLVLHLLRNLAFIRDLRPSAHVSADATELATMQSSLVLVLQETHVLRLLSTIAANADKDKLLESWNILVLEIVYLILRGIKPEDLAMEQEKHQGATLQRLLAAEGRAKQGISRNATSRHSRFGTTIAVSLNPKRKQLEGSGGPPAPAPSTSARPLVLHRQQAVNNSAGALLDLGKKRKGRKGLTVDELTRDDNLSLEARKALQHWAFDFLEECFNPFVATLIKDIRSERPKITDKDHLRLLYVSKWFLEFFLALRLKVKSDHPGTRWNFGLVAQVTEREWIGWVFKRMREAVEEKPKLWAELQTGLDCLTQLLLLLDEMASSLRTSTAGTPPQVDHDGDVDADLPEQATILQQQLVYNGEIIDLALESLRTYRPGTQNLKYLDASVGFAWALIRMVERMNKRNASGVAALVRQKKVKKRKKGKKGVEEQDADSTNAAKADGANGEGVQGDARDVDEDDEDEANGNESESEIEIRETMFTFEAFEMRLANAEITNTLLTYLARYKEFATAESMRRVVNLLHRQAVRAKAEGLFFNVSTLDLFRAILADQKTFPRDQPYKDLVTLINFILRQFFKALEKDTFLAVEVFFPKNRGNWKQYSSWEPEFKSSQRGKREKGHLDGENGAEKKAPLEVRVKKGYSWSDQLGIAIAALTEAGQDYFVQWTKEILTLVTAQRQRIIDETDSPEGGRDMTSDDDDGDAAMILDRKNPSSEALAKMTDYSIPYVNDEQAQAASSNPQLRLMFRLCKFAMRDDNADEVEWYVPAAILVSDLKSMLVVIEQFIANPINLDGKKASQLLTKQTLRSRRRRRQPSISSDDEAVLSDDGEPRRKKKEKKNKEQKEYKSAQFIEDSDAEYGDIEAFLDKEKVLRDKAMAAAAQVGIVDRPVGMRATGTKKRRRRIRDEGKGGKRRKGETVPQEADDNPLGLSSTDSGSALESVDELDTPSVVEVTKEEDLPPSRPKPRPLAKDRTSATETEPASPQSGVGEVAARRRTKRLVLSDDDE